MSQALYNSLVRILDASGVPAGAGFLAAGNRILTCAHVVGEAEEVAFDFPLLAPGKTCTGRVTLRDAERDIACLDAADLPAGAAPVRLVQAETLWGHPFRAFGFPAGHDSGVWASGVLRDRDAQGWLHIEDTKTTGYAVQPGFSGGPVWDEELHAVVGMVAAAERTPGVKAAFCIPVAHLTQAVPELGEHAIPPNPYRGLYAFREQDAPLFFGREQFSEKLLEAVSSRPLVAVVGSSGAGKSSVVFAGLLPKLRPNPEWRIADFRPGPHPFESLAAALLPLLEPQMSETDRLLEMRKLSGALKDGELRLGEVVQAILKKHGDARHLLLFADQFEELYTLCDDAATRRSFTDTLLNGRNTQGLTLLLTLRADFMGQALSHRPFADALQNADLKLGPMTSEELMRAVTQPAEKGGVRFEEGLPDLIVADVQERPGALPLLEFALTQLWERQEAGRLTLAAYQAVGGVEGALARYADEVYAALTPEERERARHVFTQLVTPGAGTEDTRRLARRADFRDADWALVRRLADARLVVTDRTPEGEESAEVVHETLISAWARLRAWMEADRAFRIWQEDARRQARLWKDGGRTPDALLRGAFLAQAEGYLETRPQDIEPGLAAFITASREHAEAERQARERARRRIIWGLSAGLLVFALLALFAWGQRNTALSQRQAAFARQLAAQALYMHRAPRSTTEEILAPLLAMAALKQGTPSVEPMDVLQNVLWNWPALHLIRHEGVVFDVAFSPDGRYLATASDDGTAALVDVATGREIARIRHDGTVLAVAFSPDTLSGTGGRYLATASGDGTAALVEVATGQEIARIHHEDAVWNVAFSPDGGYLATGSADGTAALVEVATGREIARIRHEGLVRAVAFSPVGRYLATASADGTAALVEVATGREIARIQHEDVVWNVTFSPDGRYLATASFDYTAALVEVPTGEEIARIQHEDVVWNVTFSPDGRYLATASFDYTAALVEVPTGEEIARIRHENGVLAVAFSPDGRYLATASGDGTAALVETSTGREIARIQHEGPVRAVAYSPDTLTGTGERYLATASGDGTAALVEVTTGQEIARIRHEGYVNAVAFSPDGRYLATASADGTAALVDLQRLMLHIRHAGAVQDVAFSPEGRYLAISSGNPISDVVLVEMSSGQKIARLRYEAHHEDWTQVVGPGGRYLAMTRDDNTVMLMETASGQEIARIRHARAVTAVVFSPGERYLATGSLDGTAALVESATGREIARIRHVLGVRSVAFSSDGRYLVTASWDGTVVLVDVAVGQEITRIRQVFNVWNVAFSPSTLSGTGGRYLATVSDENMVVLLDVNTGQEIARIRHEAAVDAVVFSPDGRYLATASDDGTAALVETATGEEIARIRHDGAVTAVTFSPDGRYLATASWDGTAALVETATGREITRIQHEGPVRDVAFSPDTLSGTGGRYLATASNDGTAALVETASGREIARIHHAGGVNAVAFSPDGYYLAAASADGTAALVEVATGREIARIRHEGPVWAVAFSPGGHYLATAGGSDVFLLPLEQDELFAQVCARLPRNLTRAEWNTYVGSDVPYEVLCPNLPVPEE